MKRSGFEFKFKLKWPDRKKGEQGQAQYEALVESYLQEHQDAMLAHSQRPISLVTKRPIYLRCKKIGKGTFGTVYKVIDVSTGLEYAAKTLGDFKRRNEAAILSMLSHVGVIVRLQ